MFRSNSEISFCILTASQLIAFQLTSLEAMQFSDLGFL